MRVCEAKNGGAAFLQNQEPLNPTLQLNTKTVSTKDVEIILHKRVAEVTHTLQYTKLGQPANLRASIGPRQFGVWGLGFRISRVQGQQRTRRPLKKGCRTGFFFFTENFHKVLTSKIKKEYFVTKFLVFLNRGKICQILEKKISLR